MSFFLRYHRTNWSSAALAIRAPKSNARAFLTVISGTTRTPGSTRLSDRFFTSSASASATSHADRQVRSHSTTPITVTNPFKNPYAEMEYLLEEKLALEEGKYVTLEQPSNAGRHIKVITIGAGISAIQFAHDIVKSKMDVEHVIYDRNPEIGGTWWENIYPGVRCDVPAVSYQYSHMPWDKWTEFYASGAEIQAYLIEVVSKYDLRKYMKLSHSVVDARWDEESQEWVVKIQRGDDPNDVFEDRANVLVDSSGCLNKIKWPDIPGREKFKGPMVHPSKWPKGFEEEIKGKTVAVIGNGSTGIQIVPNIRPLVKNLKCFIRSPSYVLWNLAVGFTKGGENFKFTEKQKQVLANDPDMYLKMRKAVENEMNSRFKFIPKESEFQVIAQKLAKADMVKRLSRKPWLAEHLVPKDFGFGCRRPTPGNGYLEALCEDNVDVYPGTIPEITEKGIRDHDGVEHEVDVIICATGFDSSRAKQYGVIGREGRRLEEEWKDDSKTYLGLSVPGFPNYLLFNGPYGPITHGSYFQIAEHTSAHFILMLRKLSHEYVSSFSPSPRATADYLTHQRVFMKRTVWSDNCSSWFKGGTTDGNPTTWPGSRIHYFMNLAQVRWEDYDLTWVPTGEGDGVVNRFWYLGNGFDAREFDGSDLSWYMGLLGGLDKKLDITPDDVAILTGKGAVEEV